MAIPPLHHGVLPPGVHDCTLDEVGLVFGAGNPSPRRAELWQGAEEFVAQIQPTGAFTHVYIDGSFTTDKHEPGDVDLILATEQPASHSFARLQNSNILHLLNLAVAKERFHVHVYTAFPPYDDSFLVFFQSIRAEEALKRGLPQDFRRGILRATL